MAKSTAQKKSHWFTQTLDEMPENISETYTEWMIYRPDEEKYLVAPDTISCDTGEVKWVKNPRDYPKLCCEFGINKIARVVKSDNQEDAPTLGYVVNRLAGMARAGINVQAVPVKFYVDKYWLEDDENVYHNTDTFMKVLWAGAMHVEDAMDLEPGTLETVSTFRKTSRW